MVQKSKKVVVYVYSYKLDSNFNSAQNFKPNFDIKKAKDNTVKYGDCFLLLVVDRLVGNFIYARLLKLRKDSPDIIKLSNGSERSIDLLDDENIKETSHFIMNIKDNVIFGEYNHFSIRHFRYPLAYYFDEIFDLEDSEVTPLRDNDTFKNMEKDKEFKSISVRIAQSSLSKKEEEVGIPVIGALKELSSSKESVIDISFSKGRKKDSELNKEKVTELAKTLKTNREDLQVLKIESLNATYDILNNNLLFYTCEVGIYNRNVDKDSFYNEVEDVYKERIDYVRTCVKAS